jgi:hypothetical protein
LLSLYRSESACTCHSTPRTAATCSDTIAHSEPTSLLDENSRKVSGRSSWKSGKACPPYLQQYQRFHHLLTKTKLGFRVPIGKGRDDGITAVFRGPRFVGTALLGKSISTYAPSLAAPVWAFGPSSPGFVGPNGSVSTCTPVSTGGSALDGLIASSLRIALNPSRSV